MNRTRPIRNKQNIEYSNDSFTPIGFVAVHDDIIAPITNTFDYISNDNIENSMMIDASNHCYNRKLQFAGRKDIVLIGRYHVNDGIVDSYNHIVIDRSNRSLRKPDINLESVKSSRMIDVPSTQSVYHGIDKQSANNDINGMTDFYVQKSAYMRKKQTQKRDINTDQDELLSLALTDSIIKQLESAQSARIARGSFADDSIGCSWYHLDDNSAYLQTGYNNAISSLSDKWRAAKRPQSADRQVVRDKDGNVVDSLDFMAVNNRTGNNFHARAKKLFRNNGTLLTVFTMTMDGHDQSSIAETIGKSVVTVKRLYKAVKGMIDESGLVNELSEFVQYQDNTPSYSWTGNAKKAFAQPTYHVGYIGIAPEGWLFEHNPVLPH